MDYKRIARIDTLEDERVKDFLNKDAEGELVFKYSRIRESIAQDCIYISNGRNPLYAASSLPLYSGVFISLCPGCLQKSQLKYLLPLFDTGHVFPVLTSRYIQYNPVCISEIIKYAHISMYEHVAHRLLKVAQDGMGAVCPECYNKQLGQLEEAIPGNCDVEYVYDLIQTIYDNL
jgi:hypothetical protein